RARRLRRNFTLYPFVAQILGHLPLIQLDSEVRAPRSTQVHPVRCTPLRFELLDERATTAVSQDFHAIPPKQSRPRIRYKTAFVPLAPRRLLRPTNHRQIPGRTRFAVSPFSEIRNFSPRPSPQSIIGNFE